VRLPKQGNERIEIQKATRAHGNSSKSFRVSSCVILRVETAKVHPCFLMRRIFSGHSTGASRVRINLSPLKDCTSNRSPGFVGKVTRFLLSAITVIVGLSYQRLMLSTHIADAMRLVFIAWENVNRGLSMPFAEANPKLCLSIEGWVW